MSYSYNVERAKKLLSEAGYASGFKCTFDGRPLSTDLDIYQIIKSYLSEIVLIYKSKLMEPLHYVALQLR